MKRFILIAACALLCLVCAPRAQAAGGYLAEIPADRLIQAAALTGELRQASGDVWLVENERDLAALRGAGLVLYAEPNCALTVEANSWHIDAVHVPDAWLHTDGRGNYDRRGSGVTVAVIDSGVDADNSDFNPDNILPYRDYGNNKNGVDIWHGTFVAGIIAAQYDNGVGIDGVAPDVKILPVTITSGGVSDAFTAIRAIEYAASRADVINLSIGGGAASSFLERTCRNAVRDGTILVAAAGNYKTEDTPSERNVTYPAGYDCVISVSSCKQQDGTPVFDSLYSYFNRAVNVSAPGSSIRSLYLTGGTAVASGTSFAAPIVSAMAAIAKQVNPAIDSGTFLSLLEATGTDLGEPGRDVYYGAGFVNIRTFLDKLDEQYPIRFFSGEDEARFEEPAPDTYTIADGEIILPEPVREGWVFKGWYESADLSGTPVTKIPAASTGERSYYARWESLPNEPPAVTGAPEAAEAAPASLDGLTPAAAYAAELTDWFADPEGSPLEFDLISGPGTLEGSAYTYLPEAADAGQEYTVTLRAADDRGQSVRHTFTLRVGALPVSQSLLRSDEISLNLSTLPEEVSAPLALYGNHVTRVRMGEADLTWRVEDETLFVSLPVLAEGAYEITVEFDAGRPAIWRWTVIRDYPLLTVYPDAPTEAYAVPPSLDGISSATPYRANVSNWFSVRGIDYSLVSGPGVMEESYYIYTPTTDDAGKDYGVTVRAADSHGQSAEHSFLLHVDPLPASQSLLNSGPVALGLSQLPKEVSASLTLYGNRVTAVHLGGNALPWRLDGETLYAVVPVLAEGDYEVTVEFDAGDPVAWPWRIERDYPLLEVSPDAPAAADAAPASLDGGVPAAPCTADISGWFTVTGIDYALISGPGVLEGSTYTYIPTAGDAGQEYTVTVRAADSHGQSAEHSFLLRVGPLPVSQSVLNSGPVALGLSQLPKEVSASLTLYGNRVTAVRLGDDALTWRMEGETLYASVPVLAEGDYEVTVEFDAGDPVVWPWRIERDYPLLERSPDAPAAADAAPASLDGRTPAIPCTADISDWFTVSGIDYVLISGPGVLEGSTYTYSPTAGDAGKEYAVTVRAADSHGQSAEHTLLLRTGPLPVSQSVLTGAFAMNLCDPVEEAAAALTLYGNRVARVRLGGDDLTWRVEDASLLVSVPALAEGEYEVTVEFDAGDPVAWPWRVYRDCPSAPFRDISLDAWYHSDVDYAVKHGLMNGVASDRFAPESGFTRAMLVTVLHRAAGTPEAPSPAPFADVAADAWYSGAVAWAYAAGVVNGVAPDRFAPDAPVTREQLVTILYRYAGGSEAADLNVFPDAGEVSDYAREAMSWAIARGLVNGIARDGATVLSPRGGATRAQVAAILKRFLR